MVKPSALAGVCAAPACHLRGRDGREVRFHIEAFADYLVSAGVPLSLNIAARPGSIRCTKSASKRMPVHARGCVFRTRSARTRAKTPAVDVEVPKASRPRRVISLALDRRKHRDLFSLRDARFFSRFVPSAIPQQLFFLAHDPGERAGARARTIRCSNAIVRWTSFQRRQPS